MHNKRVAALIGRWMPSQAACLSNQTSFSLPQVHRHSMSSPISAEPTGPPRWPELPRFTTALQKPIDMTSMFYTVSGPSASAWENMKACSKLRFVWQVSELQKHLLEM